MRTNRIGNENIFLTEPLRFFKEKTTGHHIIMGRKTFESLGKRLLPNRTSIVITRNKDYEMPEGGIVASSLVNALETVKNETEVFFIGGAQIYKIAIPFANTMYITRVHHYFEGDAFFPEYENIEWKTEELLKTEENEISYSRILFERVK